MASRKLRRGEVQGAYPVFKDSLPWGHITLTDREGAGRSLYVMGRTVHVGPEYFTKGMDQVQGGVSDLVHELTHVWQHEHGVNGAVYLVGSIAAQVVHGKAEAYVYTEGKPWNAYNPEQQAQIVRHWFAGGMSPSDSLFPYVRDNIWAKSYDPKTEGARDMKW
ncbi:MAG TPA: hypothetical protein VF699_07365 [Caulobacteraceae bacterium]|jgi:hypothetical protein